MLVFPSRFKNKPDSFDKSAYFELDKLNLVSKKQVEITISALVVSLRYSDDFTIIKHLNKGVKVQDKDKNQFLIEFSRDDLLSDKKNQHTTTISIFARNCNESKNKNNLINFIKISLEKSLEPLYTRYKYLLEKDIVNIGKLDLFIEEDYDIDNLISLKNDDINLVVDKELNGSFDKRAYESVEKNIENDLNTLHEKLATYKAKNDINLLHLSDLHFEEDTNIENEIILLKKDFKTKEKGLKSISHIILSGDLSAHGKAKEFERVSTFISILIELCDIDAQKVIVVAGNHDYNRNITHNAYFIKDFSENDFKDKIDYKINDRIYLKRDKGKWDNKFKNFSEYLYESIYNQSFSTTNYTKVMQDDKIAFVLMNTSREIDHFSPRNVMFDTNSFINVQNDIDDSKIKFAVGHHPLDYENSYPFIDNLHNFGYKGYIHGHVHRNNLISFKDMISSDTNLIQIGSGLFSSKSSRSMRPGVPYRYNIIRIKFDIKTKKPLLTVETREREKTTMHWRPAYIYPDGNNMVKNTWDEK